MYTDRTQNGTGLEEDPWLHGCESVIWIKEQIKGFFFTHKTNPPPLPTHSFKIPCKSHLKLDNGLIQNFSEQNPVTTSDSSYGIKQACKDWRIWHVVGVVHTRFRDRETDGTKTICRYTQRVV